MKITISKTAKLRFVPQRVDEEATEEARSLVDPEERDDVEEIMVDCDEFIESFGEVLDFQHLGFARSVHSITSLADTADPI